MSIVDLVYVVAWPPAWAFLWSAIGRLGPPWAAVPPGCAWVCGGGGIVIGYGAGGQWPEVVIGVVQVAIGAWLWRRGGRRRRRAPRAYGAKSRALVASLAAKARDAARPRPVLRPVPGMR